MNTTTLTCFGCNKTAICEAVGCCSSKLDKCIQGLRKQGWQRRAFIETNHDQGPWFCSYDCAYYSDAAKRAEQLTAEDFKKYCQETEVPITVWFSVVLIIFVIVVFILGDCFNA